MRYSHACTAIMALVLTLVLIGCGKDEPRDRGADTPFRQALLLSRSRSLVERGA